MEDNIALPKIATQHKKRIIFSPQIKMVYIKSCSSGHFLKMYFSSQEVLTEKGKTALDGALY